MRRRHQFVMRFMIAALLAAPATITACAGYAVSERYYDPYHGGHRRWDHREDGFYRRWEVETNRPHVDFGRRPAAEQRAYLGWRHGR